MVLGVTCSQREMPLCCQRLGHSELSPFPQGWLLEVHSLLESHYCLHPCLQPAPQAGQQQGQQQGLPMQVTGSPCPQELAPVSATQRASLGLQASPLALPSEWLPSKGSLLPSLGPWGTTLRPMARVLSSVLSLLILAQGGISPTSSRAWPCHTKCVLKIPSGLTHLHLNPIKAQVFAFCSELLCNFPHNLLKRPRATAATSKAPGL